MLGQTTATALQFPGYSQTSTPDNRVEPRQQRRRTPRRPLSESRGMFGGIVYGVREAYARDGQQPRLTMFGRVAS
jgi:hypothetical protein